jgi:hypothetical protein
MMLRRLAPTFAILALLALAGFFGASLVVAHEPAANEASAAAADLVPDISSVRFTGRVADPGGRAPWALRTHRGRTGRFTCFEIGQVVDGKGFGRQEKAGFVGRGRGAAGGPSGSCAELRLNPSPLMVAIEGDVASGDGGRTAFYGLLAPDVDHAEIAVPGEPVKRVRPAADRTFLAVYEGEIGHDDYEVTFVGADGSRRLVTGGPRIR